MVNKNKNPKLIAYNSVYLFVRMLLVTILGFFTGRFTLMVLGDVDYGINDLVLGVISSFAVFSLPIITSIQRFFNVEFVNNKYTPLVVFNTCAIISLVLSVFMVILYEVIGLYLVNNQIDVPEDRLFATKVIFQISCFTNFVNFLTIPYQAFLNAKEKMNILAITQIGSSLITLLFIILLMKLPIDKLIGYSFIPLICSILLFIFYCIYCNRKYIETKFSLVFDKALLKQIMSFSGYNLIESGAGVILYFGMSFLINTFGGILYNAAYGVSRHLHNVVNSFSLNILKAFEPQITSAHTIGDFYYRDSLIFFSVKIAIFIVGMIAILFCNNSFFLLDLWLDAVPKYAEDFSIIFIVSCVFVAAKMPLRSLLLANGEVKKYFIIYGIITFVYMGIMVLLLKLGFPMISAMYIMLLCIISQLILTLVFLKLFTNFPVLKMSFQIGLLIFILSVSAMTYQVILLFDISNSFLKVLLAELMSFSTLILSFYYFSLNKNERVVLLRYFKKILNRTK